MSEGGKGEEREEEEMKSGGSWGEKRMRGVSKERSCKIRSRLEEKRENEIERAREEVKETRD